MSSTRSQSEERYTISESGHSRDSGEKKEKRSFWGGRDQRERDRGGEKVVDRLVERERDRGREILRESDGVSKLTRMIGEWKLCPSLCDCHSSPILPGYLTGTAAEDWPLLMDVCDRASASEANAKAAVRALRSEFKYGRQFHLSPSFLTLSL